MYTRRQAVGRVYVCSHRRLCDGLCNAEPVPAALAEANVLSHLERVVGKELGEWLQEKAKAHTASTTSGWRP
jgi:hypothetical protein